MSDKRPKCKLCKAQHGPGEPHVYVTDHSSVTDAPRNALRAEKRPETTPSNALLPTPAGRNALYPDLPDPSNALRRDLDALAERVAALEVALSKRPDPTNTERQRRHRERKAPEA